MNVPEVVTKPKPNLPLKVEAFWNPAEAKLELQMELLPTSELSHHQLAAMFDGDVDTSVESSNDRDILKVKVTFKHDKDVATAGKVAHDEHLAARDKGMHIDQYREWKAGEEKKAAAKKLADEKAVKKATAAEKKE